MERSISSLMVVMLRNDHSHFCKILLMDRVRLCRANTGQLVVLVSLQTSVCF
jgi:hypothetical protein